MVSDKDIEDLMNLMKKEGINCWLVSGKEMSDLSEKTKEESK